MKWLLPLLMLCKCEVQRLAGFALDLKNLGELKDGNTKRKNIRTLQKHTFHRPNLLQLPFAYA